MKKSNNGLTIAEARMKEKLERERKTAQKEYGELMIAWDNSPQGAFKRGFKSGLETGFGLSLTLIGD